MKVCQFIFLFKIVFKQFLLKIILVAKPSFVDDLNLSGSDSDGSEL